MVASSAAAPKLASRRYPVVEQRVIGPERPAAKRQAAPDHVRGRAPCGINHKVGRLLHL